MSPFRLSAFLLPLCLAGSLAAQDGTPEQQAKREQDALKRAKVLRIIGIPGVTPSLAGVLRELRAKVGEQEVRIELAASDLFESGKPDLQPEASTRLEKVAVVLREFPAAPLVRSYPAVPSFIECCGEEGGDPALSDQRAAAVKHWLVENAGIDPVRLSTLRPKPASSGAGPDEKDPQSRGKGGTVAITVRKGQPADPASGRQ